MNGNVTEWKHPIYSARLADWERNKAFVDGGEAIKEYLHKHKIEKQFNFLQRKERTHYANRVREIVDRWNLALFGLGYPKIELSPELDFLRQNADGEGRTLQAYARSLSETILTFGSAIIGVDMPEVGSEIIRTAADLEQSGIAPYLLTISPIDCPFWAMENGRFTRLLYVENSTGKQTKLYYDWSLESVAIYNKDGEFLNAIDHNLGCIPFAVVSYGRRNSGIGTRGLVDELTPTAQAILNMESLITEIYYKQTFSQLVAQGDPVDYADKPSESESAIARLGTTEIFLYPRDCAQPAYISPDSSQSASISEKMKGLVSELYHIAYVGHLAAQQDRAITAQASGVARAFTFQDFNDALRDYSATMTEVIRKNVSLCANWLGYNEDQIAEGVDVSFPSDFGSLGADAWSGLLDANAKYIGSEKLRKQAAKKLAVAKLAGASDDIINEILSDIDETTEPIPAPSGGGNFAG